MRHLIYAVIAVIAGYILKEILQISETTILFFYIVFISVQFSSEMDAQFWKTVHRNDDMCEKLQQKIELLEIEISDLKYELEEKININNC